EPKLLAASRCPFPRLRGTAGVGVAWAALGRPCPAAPMPPPHPPPARGGGTPRSRAAPPPPPPLAGGPRWGAPGPPGRTRAPGRPPHAGEGAKEAAPRFRPFPRLRGGRDGGRLALAVASPFPCSDAPPPPSPHAGEGAKEAAARAPAPSHACGGGSQGGCAASAPTPSPACGGRPGWGPPGSRRGITVPVLRCPTPTLPRTRGGSWRLARGRWPRSRFGTREWVRYVDLGD